MAKRKIRMARVRLEETDHESLLRYIKQSGIKRRYIADQIKVGEKAFST